MHRVALFAAAAAGFEHMNQGVPYLVMNAVDPNQHFEYRGDGYFEVTTAPMNTSYGEVFWTGVPAVDLPEDVVAKFAGKNMVITGFESDVRRINPATGKEEAVPAYQSYNHHWGAQVTSSEAEFVGMEGHDFGHGPTALFRRRAGAAPPADARLALSLVHSNGNEHRQVFHGAPKGAGSVVYSPATFSFYPMQINTNDGSGAKRASGPGPSHPAGTHFNPDYTVSPLIECPCTTRTTKQAGALTGQAAGRCQALPVGQEDCFAGAAHLFHSRVATNATVATAAAPPGCFVSRTAAGGNDVTVTWNGNTASSVPCGSGAAPTKVSGTQTALVTLSVVVDAAADVATLTLTGPASVWFGVGFNAGAMADQPYAVVVLGNGTVTERKLQNHDPGALLAASVRVASSAVSEGLRTVVLTRPLKGATADHYTFSTATTTLPFINAVGGTADFSQHKVRGASSMVLLGDAAAPTCLCGGALGLINGAPYNAGCVAEPVSDLLARGNPTCQVSTYIGGLACCTHGTVLLDADQPRPAHKDSVYYRWRVYYEEYPAHGTPPKSLYHVEWAANGCNSGVATSSHVCTHIEFDVTPGAPTQTFQSTFKTSWMMGKSCTPTEAQCMDLGKVGPSGQIELFMAAHHCHAPNCVRQELWNKDTGTLLCRVEPVIGGSGDAYNEDGYLYTPPCAWSHEDPALPAPPALGMNTTLQMISIYNSTYNHPAQMAIWQMKAAFV
eukprot:TRINITY_DN20314_c0_g1_i1.p1 TRINITY_DN20314_c0_g1~~TRINITY_DN20314_c0_g1_i1.p1  ORF type:complete len:742 (+),score=233.77 TRINITY_DN20314_c0_g1_i1:50-2227(+)